jgi:hypothetical protein
MIKQNVGVEFACPRNLSKKKSVSIRPNLCAIKQLQIEHRLIHDSHGLNLTHPVILLLRREGFVINTTIDM